MRGETHQAILLRWCAEAAVALATVCVVGCRPRESRELPPSASAVATTSPAPSASGNLDERVAMDGRDGRAEVEGSSDGAIDAPVSKATTDDDGVADGGAAGRCSRGEPMTVTFYDVGQGLAALVELPDQRRVLVDTGESPTRPKCGPCARWHDRVMAGLRRDVGPKPIDVVWITHPHSDHVGGAADVLSKFVVKNLVDNGTGVDHPAVAASRASARANGVAIHVVDTDHRAVPIANSDGLTLSAVVPKEWVCPTVNDCSVGLRIDYCRSSVLFVGDAESFEETHLEVAEATLLQVAHHGSDTSTHEGFLQKVKPRYAVISSARAGEGTNRTFCHPRLSTLETISRALGTAPARTMDGFDGAVRCASRAGRDHWRKTSVASTLWSTAQDGEVVLQTRGDGVFTRIHR